MEIRTRIWQRVRKPLALLLALLIVACVVDALTPGGVLPQWGRAQPVAVEPAEVPESTYEWIGGYVRWDESHDEGRVPFYPEELDEGGELRYVIDTFLGWAAQTFVEDQFEVESAIAWRGLLFIQARGDAVDPVDGSGERWMVIFSWVPETGRYELVWAEIIDTVARYEARVGGGE